jgi:hypothetical protein
MAVREMMALSTNFQPTVILLLLLLLFGMLM